MKRILFFLLATVMMTGCINEDIDDLKKDIDDLKERMEQYESLIDVLNNRLYVTSYETKDGHYVITMSDGSKLSVRNTSLFIEVGENGNWWIDGEDTGLSAVGGGTGEVPRIAIGENGNWWINGEDTGVSAEGQAGKDASEIISIALVDGVMTFTFADGRTVSIDAVAPEIYINGVTRVYEYLPAPGQFINTLPAWAEGDTEETMRQKAENALVNGSMICLGGFGGYVVIGFDHTIVNKEGADFVVLGNAFDGWAEPGVIMVSRDVNENGLPDDEWYEIAGSEYNKSTTIKNYEITYYKPESEPSDPNEPNYIRWTDNQGQSGYLSKNSYHSQTYYPQWKGNSYTLKGTFMEANIYDQSGTGTYWVNPAYDWGYADNMPNNNDKAQINIDWAVNKNGVPVRLKGIDFVKVYTANRAEGGWLGEVSTEVSGFRDLNLH